MPISSEATVRIITNVEAARLMFCLELIEAGHPTLTTAGTLAQEFSAGLSGELAWYLELFLDERDDAAVVRAKHVRNSIKSFGRLLFQNVFQSTADGRTIWRRVAPRIASVRIEVHEDGGSLGILWELLRDPKTNTPLCLSAATFVRTYGTGFRGASEALSNLRILLVLSRPNGASDVELRTIASLDLRVSPDQSPFQG